MHTRTPPPTLGTDLDSIHRAWRELSKTASSQHVVSAFVPFLGRFAYRGDRIVKLTTHSDARGTSTTYQSATRTELDEIDHAIQSGAIEIEARTASGALGYGDGGHRTRTYHQATGRALPPPTRAATLQRAHHPPEHITLELDPSDRLPTRASLAPHLPHPHWYLSSDWDADQPDGSSHHSLRDDRTDHPLARLTLHPDASPTNSERTTP